MRRQNLRYVGPPRERTDNLVPRWCHVGTERAGFDPFCSVRVRHCGALKMARNLGEKLADPIRFERTTSAFGGRATGYISVFHRLLSL
jgi:hypothetical protein